ncbi:MAG: glycoside hydrolase family 15 protein [Candidatus Nanoarchaeia archaeon]
MTRNLVLGNQQLFVGIDRWLQVRDIFYPHVGQYNHLMGHAHRICVLEGDSLSWINQDMWKKTASYLHDTLVTNNTATKEDIELNFNDNVFCEANIFFRRIRVKNRSGRKRKIRLCFHQDFHLYGDGIGDTALYQPKHEAIIHYKKSAYFLLGLCYLDGGNAMHDFDIGEHINPGWHLRRNPISQGEVDSLLAVDLEIGPGGEESFCAYMLAGKDFEEVFALQEEFLKKGVDEHLRHTDMCQRGLTAGKPDISMLDERLVKRYSLSLLILRAHVDREGAITAANDSDNMKFNKDTYSYCWPRDGALTSIALIRSGMAEMTKPFFIFCKDVLFKEGCLLHKYNPDRTLGSSWHPWILDGKYSLPIQEDETALVLHALHIYYEHTKDKRFIKELYPSLIRPMGDFLSGNTYGNGLPKESYDLWEERRAIFTFTTASVLAGLIAADRLGAVFKDKDFCRTCITGYKGIKDAMVKYLYDQDKKYFRRAVSFEDGKIVNDDALDSSAYALWAFGAFEPDDPMVESTMKRIREWLWVKTPVGGIARYYDDEFHQQSRDLDAVPGNPWFICTLWYAKWLIRKAKKKEDLAEALELIKWAADHALPTGVMSEQLHPFSGEPLSVSPLTWSHAEFVDAINDYAEAYKRL